MLEKEETRIMVNPSHERSHFQVTLRSEIIKSIEEGAPGSTILFNMRSPGAPQVTGYGIMAQKNISQNIG